MRKLLLAILLAASGPAFACTSGPLTSITLTTPANFATFNSTTCGNVTSGVTVFVSPTTLATAALANAGGNWQIALTPNANGSGTLTIKLPGYTTLSIPLTVSLATMEIDSQ